MSELMLYLYGILTGLVSVAALWLGWYCAGHIHSDKRKFK